MQQQITSRNALTKQFQECTNKKTSRNALAKQFQECTNKTIPGMHWQKKIKIIYTNRRISGMPGTLFPDSLILYKKYPPPREVFEALMSSGFVFIGAGPLDPADLWFLKKVSVLTNC